MKQSNSNHVPLIHLSPFNSVLVKENKDILVYKEKCAQKAMMMMMMMKNCCLFHNHQKWEKKKTGSKKYWYFLITKQQVNVSGLLFIAVHAHINSSVKAGVHQSRENMN